MPSPDRRVGSASQVQVLDRAVRLLKTLSEANAELGASELSARLRLHKSTVHRLLTAMEEHRLVEKNGLNAKYNLGLRLFELGSVAVRRTDVCILAPTYLEWLAGRTGETAHLGILRDTEVVSIVAIESNRTVRTPSTVGSRAPVHCTSQGKAILAHLPESYVEGLFKGHRLKRFTTHTITAFGRFRKELLEVRARGYAVDNEEFEEGLRCIGAPVRNHSENVVGAISIACPAFRVSESDVPGLARHVIQAADALSSALGYRESGSTVDFKLNRALRD